MYCSLHMSVQEDVSVWHKKCITVCTCLFRKMSVFDTRNVLKFAHVCSGGCQHLTQEVYYSLHTSVQEDVSVWHKKCITGCTCLFRKMSVCDTRSVQEDVSVWHKNCITGCKCLFRKMSVCDTRSVLQFARVCSGGPGQGSTESGQRGERERACFI